MRKPKLLAATLLAATILAAAPQQFPNTPAARQFSIWLDTFNSDDRARILKYLQANFPERAKNIERTMEFRKSTGGFDFQKVESSTPTRFSGILQERHSGQLAHFVMEVDPSDPEHVGSFLLEPLRSQSETGPPPARMSESGAMAALRARLEKDAASGEFSGAVLVAKNGAPIFTSAYGMADREKKIPNTINTLFRLGSMNKMFTAVAVLQLVQAGKISLDDPLGKYLPDYPNKDVATKVTIHELLTHTGGTGDFFGPEFEAHRMELRTLQDYVNLFGQRGPEFAPGSRWEYSNYGFILLGAVIERVRGESYYDYVREHIYKPAGMESTGSLPEDAAVPNRSIGYMKDDDGKLVPNTDTLPYRGTSAGGGYSTVGDLLRFANALENHKLLDPHYTELLTTGKVETPGGFKDAYGFGDHTRNGVRSIGHNGGAPGMNGDLEIFPESGYVVAVLANMDPPAAGRIEDFIEYRLPAK
jgi:CubicO group peptidase (beta-lactamase class C family)